MVKCYAKGATYLVFMWAGFCSGQTVCPKHIETPDYPPMARIARLQAKVTLRVTINAEGNVTNAEVADDVAHRANQVLLKAAIDNMQRWTFEKPATAPTTQVIVYEYKMDSSLPVSRENYQITKVNIDLPETVTILTNELTWNPEHSGGEKR